MSTTGAHGDLQSNDNSIVFGTNKVTLNGTDYWGNGTVTVVVFKGLFEG